MKSNQRCNPVCKFFPESVNPSDAEFEEMEFPQELNKKGENIEE